MTDVPWLSMWKEVAVGTKEPARLTRTKLTLKARLLCSRSLCDEIMAFIRGMKAA